jgi:hypothetical protein
MVKVLVGPRPSIRFSDRSGGSMARETTPRCEDAALMRAAADGIDDVAERLLALHEQWKAARRTHKST